jgi:catalase
MARKIHYLSTIFHIATMHPSILIRYAIIAVILGGIAYAYAVVAGWITLPAQGAQLSPKALIDAFEANTRPHPGFRRNHAKGICVQGHFESNGNAIVLSRASVFNKGVVPVVGRLSMPGSDPAQEDGTAPVRSFALRFRLRDGEEWRTAMNSVPIFAVRTPDDLYAQLVALRPDKDTGKAKPARMDAFMQTHPETRAFHAWTESHPPSSGFDNAAYFSVNAFRFVDASGAARYVRWSVVPDTPYEPMTGIETRDPDFLAHGLVTRIEHGPVRWHLMITVAKPGDPTDDATRLWPEGRGREHVDAGTLVIDNAQSQIDGPCRDINFDPLILPDGIEPSGDPLLAARSAAYAVSFDRRVREEARFESRKR